MEKPSPWKSRGRRPERPSFDSLPPLVLPTTQQRQPLPTGTLSPRAANRRGHRPQKSLSLPRRSPPGRKASDSAQPDVTVSVQSASEDLNESSDEGEFGRKVQIDMKGLVGDAVGNMSISPTSRDIVLAARRGMYIIDLDAPDDLPRFLPQGGTWDVADVQWHPSRIEYIVSTSSEKLLIWNLNILGRTSIEHVLNAHYRAITDINWHPTDPNIVASTGLDSWVWIWDMRTLSKPALGLSAFQSGGTHVKFNRMDEHILASSHMNQVMIWDRRKGSLPVDRIAAHSAKIYGIDWSRHERTRLITCSLDKTIKLWDIGTLQPEQNNSDNHAPTSEIYANYPVWRARSLPFGRGLLSLPQRGGSTLEMYAFANHSAPVERFDGHSDVVKEFVWRRRDIGTGFQLITWSKDRTLRFWPIEKGTMARVGYVPEVRPPGIYHTSSESTVSLREALANMSFPPTVSVPHGHMPIYDQVRATAPTRQQFIGSRPISSNEQKQRALSPRPTLSHPAQGPSIAASVPSPSLVRRDTTMSRIVRHSRMDPLSWISGIRRDDDSTSGTDSGNNSRYGSMSRPPSRVLNGVVNNDVSFDSVRRRSSSRDPGDSGHDLREEIASTLNKLAPFKVKLEKLDARRRTCTITCHGPWGTHSVDVFIRVSFEFPRSYTSTWVAGSAPFIELDKSPLIPSTNRAIMLDNLGDISENQRPCLEACLSFLRFGDAEKSLSRPPSPGSEDSSDEELSHTKQRTVTTMMRRNDKNVAEPRTSQAVFCPNGELVYFFRAPPRIIRNVAHELARPSLVNSRESVNGHPRPPGLLSDAVRQLAMASQDRANTFFDAKRSHDATDILRIMTNLLAYPVGGRPRGFPPTPRLSNDTDTPYQVLDNRLSNVVIRDVADVVGVDRVMAAEFIYESENGPTAACCHNAQVAAKHSRYAQERMFSMLAAVCRKGSDRFTPSSVLGITRVVTVLYADLIASKNLQMLAMLSTIILQILPLSLPSTADTSLAQTPVTQIVKEPSKDYFSVRHRRDSRPSRLSPGWPSLPSGSHSTTPIPANAHTSWGKGSLSSLFQQQSPQMALQQPPDRVPVQVDDGHAASPGSPDGIPVPKRGRMQPVLETSTFKWQGHGTSSAWNSWAASRPSPLNRTPVSFSSAGHLRHRPRGSKQVVQEKITPMNKRIRVVKIVEDAPQEELFSSSRREQLLFHITAYCDLLFSWELYSQRASLLKLLHRCSGHVQLGTETAQHHDIIIGLSEPAARQSRSALPRPRCAICHLPVKALSHVCSRCSHVCHITCWQRRAWDSCPEGCGCNCISGISFSVPASEVARSVHSNLS